MLQTAQDVLCDTTRRFIQSVVLFDWASPKQTYFPGSFSGLGSIGCASEKSPVSLGNGKVPVYKNKLFLKGTLFTNNSVACHQLLPLALKCLSALRSPLVPVCVTVWIIPTQIISYSNCCDVYNNKSPDKKSSFCTRAIFALDRQQTTHTQGYFCETMENSAITVECQCNNSEIYRY